jgi:hypothetical protein
MQELTDKLAKIKKPSDAEEIYGQLQALEAQVETREVSGFKCHSKLPHDIIVDPYAEEPDASDAEWVMEHTFLPTEYLNARFTEKDKKAGKESDARVYVYKPTHKASFDSERGSRDEAWDSLWSPSTEKPASRLILLSKSAIVPLSILHRSSVRVG